MDLVIAHGNPHNKPNGVRFAKAALRAGAASVGLNEVQKLLPKLDEIPRGRLHSVRIETVDPRARSTAIVTSNEHECLGEWSQRLSEAMPKVNEKMHPDRFGVASYFAHPVADALNMAGVAHFALHPPATMMKHDNPRHPVVKAYREYLLTAVDYMRAARRAQYLLVLTMDGQASARFKAPWGPREIVADPLKLECRIEKIDWIMCDAALRFTKPLATRELYDHTALIATLAPKK
jgi:hypothetical protein